jgi:hypothetical protein
MTGMYLSPVKKTKMMGKRTERKKMTFLEQEGVLFLNRF